MRRGSLLLSYILRVWTHVERHVSIIMVLQSVLTALKMFCSLRVHSSPPNPWQALIFLPSPETGLFQNVTELESQSV